jgi:protein phosphatase
MTGAVSAIKLSVGATTDVGLKREVNEDSHLASFPIFLVADGMGGHEAGDRASRAVVDALSDFDGRTDLTPAEVVGAIATAHLAVQSIADDTERGAGTTVTGVAVVRQDDDAKWLLFNLGDSRVYRLYEDELEQLTVDHSIAQELVDQGKLRREDMATYAGKNVITRAVGADDGEADYWLMPIVTGERLLICSDGLTGEISDASLRAQLALGGPTQQTADVLIQLALKNGGRDNVTAVVVDVLQGGVDPSLEQDTSSPDESDSQIIDEIESTTMTIPSQRSKRA